MTPVQLPEVPAPEFPAVWTGIPRRAAGYTAAQLREYATQHGESILAALRNAVADYMRSEGCGCCGDDEAHQKHEAVIARLLGVAPYSDNSGFDFTPYRTPSETNSER